MVFVSTKHFLNAESAFSQRQEGTKLPSQLKSLPRTQMGPTDCLVKTKWVSLQLILPSVNFLLLMGSERLNPQALGKEMTRRDLES